MLPYQERVVVQEQRELMQKILSLSAFLNSEPLIDSEDLELLREQLDSMHAYNHVLEQRIYRFKA